jgi:hypothetical protein
MELNNSIDIGFTEGYKGDLKEDKQIYSDLASFESDNNESTNENTEKGQIIEKKDKESEEDKKKKTQTLNESSIQNKGSSNQKKQDSSLVNTNKHSTNINKSKKGTTTNLIKINNEPNLINNKQNLHNQNQVHNNQKNYIVYIFENKINFPEKELFFGALRKKKNIEDFFPKDIIYILIREEDLQNGDHKYYYKNILINEIYSILKRKDEKIFILIDIRK